MTLPQPGSNRNEKKRRLEFDNSTDNVSQNIDSWARFLVIEAKDQLPIKLNPFAISKAVSGICGEVKNVTRLRSGSLLVECLRRQQSLNLLSISTFANVEVAVSAHRTLNSCRGIIRDRARCLADMSEDEITAELDNQAVTAVKRFTVKKENSRQNTNTYLLTFARASLPQSIKAGYNNIGVEVYVPNPLRCFNCQHFGHGSKSCRYTVICYRCGGDHDGSSCVQEIKCANCGNDHVASSKSCPVWQTESKIMKVKCEQNMSYLDAKKLVKNQSTTPSTLNYSAAVSQPVSTSSIKCQTDLSWIHSDQPVLTKSISPTKPSESQPCSSISQNTVQTQTVRTSDPVVTETAVEIVHLSKQEKERKEKTESKNCQDTLSIRGTCSQLL
ncbi:uncharacterized protein [Haliotis cracherodii]|uniref:uncharacterized protein n=1 Tax=Haliotis cracherodii TaxID=6455 RepID=UPI0039EC0946